MRSLFRRWGDGMRPLAAIVAMLGLGTGSIANAGELQGPARFCGFSPIIDLKEGEAVTVLRGGIHSGTFLIASSAIFFAESGSANCFILSDNSADLLSS